jgi:hypothetical protein
MKLYEKSIMNNHDTLFVYKIYTNFTEKTQSYFIIFIYTLKD